MNDRTSSTGRKRKSGNGPKSNGKPFLNRDLTWLAFNRRVLHEALDSRTPLLERVAFLAIFNSNLDEFYQKRVGGLKRQIQMGLEARTPDGMSPVEQFTAIRRQILDMLQVQADCFQNDIKPALAGHGVHLLTWKDLTDAERVQASDYFHSNLFPVLTPLSVDPGHPFPFISNLSMSLGVLLRHPDRTRVESSDETAAPRFARVKVPRILPRWLRLESGKSGEFRFIHLEQIIRHNLDSLFEGMVIDDIMPFRITRNADVERDEDDADDLLELIEQELRDRRFAQIVRLETPQVFSPIMTKFLMQELGLGDEDVYHMPAELEYTDLWLIHDVGLPKLKYQPWTPAIPSRLGDDEKDLFTVIREGDLLVHHPYDSFRCSVERFIRDATQDPKVLAIKLTLYRTSEDSPFIPDLIAAAEAGKQVACLVELKARFDEERNVRLAQRLEKAGIHVVYGVVGLKTHTKTAMVVRHEPDGIRTYCHIGTGNYNSKTANIYTDLGLFTCRPHITGELVRLFHHLTGRTRRNQFKHLLVAPLNMKQRFYELIEREMTHCEDWKKRGGDPEDPDRPRIIAKMNSLEDRGICRKLYDASNAGVRIDLIVRGFCCLRPGVPGVSANIRVTSVIGRFLEHSRIFFFHNRGQAEYFIGSADWMYRNLNNRVECITPVYDPALQQKLMRILQIMQNDHRQAWDMQPDGNYVQRQPSDDLVASRPREYAMGTHARLMELAREDAYRPGRK